MSTFNTYVKLGTRGNSLLSFNLSACTNSNVNSCTPLPNYQNVLHTNFDGLGLYITGLTLFSTNYIYIETNSIVTGDTGNTVCSVQSQMIHIDGLPATPTPTPTPLPTAVPTAVPTSTPTPSPAPATYTPTPTPTPTNTPTPTITPIPYRYSSINATTSCLSGSTIISPVFDNSNDFCSANTIYAVEIYTLSAGINVWISHNGDYREGTTRNPNVGIIDFFSQCTPCPTPTVYSSEWSYDANSFSSACDKHYVPSISTYYSLTNSYAINTYLYTNQACTAQYKAPAGYYSNGADYFVIDSNGKITQTVIQGCPSYWYYPMSSCDGLTNVTGRSSSDISIIGPITVMVPPNTCYTIHLDFGTTSFHQNYTYNIDNLTPVTDCNDSNCEVPPIYSQWLLTYNNGDFASSACSGNSGNRQPALYYTEAGTPLNNGSVLYSVPTLGQFTAANGYYSNGIFNWEIVSDGILTNQTPCGS